MQGGQIHWAPLETGTYVLAHAQGTLLAKGVTLHNRKHTTRKHAQGFESTIESSYKLRECDLKYDQIFFQVLKTGKEKLIE